MINHRKTSEWAVITSTAIFLTFWIIGSYDAKICHCWPLKIWATLFGVAGYFLLSISLALSSRWKPLENYFGGLDQIYLLHRRVGIWGFALILIHPLFEGIKWIPERMDKFYIFIFPIHNRLSVNFGSYAFWLMVIILAITILKLLPYDKWKSVHKFMSLVFILSSLHIVFSDKRVGSVFAQTLLYIPMALGFISIIHKQVYLEFFYQPFSFTVNKLSKISDSVTEIAISIKNSEFHFIPGQYGFFTFLCDEISKESHPFTLVPMVNNSDLSVIVKGRGDYTKNLISHLQSSSTGFLEGPHGRLDYRNGKQNQIWIAGGIGIVLFLAWIRDIKPHAVFDKNIHFYYCAHNISDAVYSQEFVDFSQKFPNFTFHLHCSSTHSRLTIDNLTEVIKNPTNNYTVYMCGPLNLTEDFAQKLQAFGIPSQNILFENFDFF